MMYIRFLTIDAGNPNIVEAAIDQFVITEGDTTTTVNTALDQQLAPEAFLVYPNPSNGQFLVDFDLPVEKGNWSLSVQNLYGVEIESRSLHSYSGQEEFALNVASGLYLLVLRQDGQVRASRKIRLE
ncbi:MAG: T9SS type A sorting domain-containing protein [Bacteroidota bacterium]